MSPVVVMEKVGKICIVIYNMYQNIKTRVKHGNEHSEYFISHTGVKQGIYN
jgi:hypothetical protein